MSPFPRYALYYAPPPDSALAQFGAHWLGRDARTGETIPRPRIDGLTDEELAALTGEPRRYGFHGTLKAPFRLAEGVTDADLVARSESFSAQRQSFAIPPLALAEIGGFLALVPQEPSVDLSTLAADCVRDFDDLRAPPDAAELARRTAAGLSAAQQALLARWGYPYVMEEFRFHLTLTDKLPPERRNFVKRALAPLVEPFVQAPLTIDAVTLFIQPAPEAPFTIAARFPFARS